MNDNYSNQAIFDELTEVGIPDEYQWAALVVVRKLLREAN